MGRFTDPHFLRRAKSRKSPKRPALPGAVIWVWAVHRPTPFNLLLFSPLPVLLSEAFSTARTQRFSAGKDGCCAPEGFSGSEPQARFCTRGQIWLLWAWNGSFPHPGEKTASQALTGQRNSVLFRRKRRVLRTRGFLTDQATGLVLHTGRNRRGLGPCCWAQKSRCPVLSDSGLLIA